MTIIIDGITIEQLREAHKIAAKVVALYGDTYLPIFERLHNDVLKIEQSLKVRALALSISIEEG